MPKKKVSHVAQQVIAQRPYPPAEMEGGFLPAREVYDWLQDTIFNSLHPIYNPDHIHLHHLPWVSSLMGDNIAFLWAGVPAVFGNKRILGTCEKPNFKGAGWSRHRQEAQMDQWFGTVPTYLITLDAAYCIKCTDLEFCSLIEHELYHICQARNRDGDLAYHRNGDPRLKMTSHDVEEFFRIPERYGVTDEVASLIDASKKRIVSDAAIAQACGSTKLHVA